MKPATDFDRITPYLAIWHGYDSAVKAELYSTGLMTSDGTYFVDPIPLQKEAFDELVGSAGIAGIILTSSNHHRALVQFAEQFPTPIFARSEAFSDAPPRRLTAVADGEEICAGLRAITIEGAAAGEIALHYASDSGTFVIGDALINFEPYGFTFLPAKYCTNGKQMRQSLRKLLAYRTERMLFAHGMPIISEASERLRGLLGSDL